MYILLGHTYSEEVWESMCTRCGLCCYEKEEGVHGEVITTDRACQFLQPDHACSVYDARFVHCSECGAVTPERLLTEPELLPFECPYLQLVTRLRQELDTFTLVGVVGNPDVVRGQEGGEEQVPTAPRREVEGR